MRKEQHTIFQAYYEPSSTGYIWDIRPKQNRNLRKREEKKKETKKTEDEKRNKAQTN